jgi:hypothetical protein
MRVAQHVCMMKRAALPSRAWNQKSARSELWPSLALLAVVCCASGAATTACSEPSEDELESGGAQSQKEAEAAAQVAAQAEELKLKEKEKEAEIKYGPPGQVVIRRMNRYEYNATMRDLLGDNSQPAKDFPADDYAKGFDNIGEALSSSPLLIEKSQAAAEKLATTVVNAEYALTQRATARVLVCEPGDGKSQASKDCTANIIRSFGRKAWRRPLTEMEVARLSALAGLAVTEGETLKQGFTLAVSAILSSPNFFYRPETAVAPGESRPLDDFELATRLSYFTWGSMPDAELSTLADTGKLRGALEAQVQRMTKDPKAVAFADQFAENWLNVRAVESVVPDAAKFPTLTPAVKTAMRAEIGKFVGVFFQEARPVTDMLSADFTFLNDALADHYGLPKPGSAELKRVAVASGDRSSVLGKGGVLLVTSNPTRTSPVKRGKWVLGRLLCQEPGPPPPGTEDIRDAGLPANATTRERLAEHRKNPACASCHNAMDPIGFGLDGFDAVGRSRTKEDGGQLLDVSGVLDTGKSFIGAAGLGGALKSDPRFTNCIAEKLFMYGLGRDRTPGDTPALTEIHAKFSAKNYVLSELVAQIATSRSFTEKRGDQ